LKAEAFQRNDEALEIYEEYHNVRFASVFSACHVYGMQQRDLYEREKAAAQSFI